MVVGIDERMSQGMVVPKFRDVSELTYEQLTDPDYRLKGIARDYGVEESRVLICSKCHHCR